jgi:hypothetical protein
MRLLSDVKGMSRLALGLGKFARHPISLDAAKAWIKAGMQQRESVFLENVRHAIFANPSSPYLRLLQGAGCSFADLRHLVHSDGLEGALERLAGAGVMVSLKEFKEVSPAVRGSQTYHFRESDFDNPVAREHFQSSTGGSTGKPSRVVIDLEHLAQSAPHWAVWFAANDLLDSPLVYYCPTHPGIMNGILRCARFGKRLERWFAIAGMATLRDRCVAATVRALVRARLGLPRVEPTPMSEVRGVGEYLRSLLDQGRRPCLNTYPSAAVRISDAMRESGVSLAGMTFLLRGEALTAARRSAIEAVGAKAVQSYGFAEGGTVAGQCPQPASVDDVHVYEDAFAILRCPRSEEEGESSGGALLLTALRPACPKVLLNTEVGDDAVVETRHCHCLFGELGYTKHLHTIRSFGKLTGEGMTFLITDLVRLLEEVLPRRFGGAPTDFQLVEEEGEAGLSRYALLISPRLGLLDEEAVRAAFLDELSQMRRYYRFKSRLWAEAGTLQVRRSNPVLTPRGKVVPVRSLRT